MSNTNELRNAAIGLAYIIRESKNVELAKTAVTQLKELRSTALTSSRPSRQNLVELIDDYIEEANELNGTHAYQIAEIIEDPSRVNTTIASFCLFVFGLFLLSLYISVVNNSLKKQ